MTLAVDEQPVEFWPTASIRSALESGDISIWQRIVVAIKRDPYGRTARQVEEVLDGAAPYGIAQALTEVLVRARSHLEANERAEAARHVRLLLDRSGLSEQEFGSRIGVGPHDLRAYLDATVSPPARRRGYHGDVSFVWNADPAGRWHQALEPESPRSKGV